MILKGGDIFTFKITRDLAGAADQTPVQRD